MLVTGGAGFLGSHIVDRFLADDSVERVVVLDNLYTGSLRNLGHLADALDAGRLVIMQRDVCDEFHVACDLIVHGASPAAPVYYVRAGARTLETCVFGMRNALRCAREQHARIVFLGTSERYGDPAVHPQVETYAGCVDPAAPRSVYDEGKRAAETLCGVYWREYDVDVRVALLFNSYGPRMARGDGRVVPAFLDAALGGAAPAIHGSGEQTRSFCYVNDTVRGLLVLAHAERDDVEKICASHETGIAPTFNVGNPEERTILDLARVVAEVTGVGGAPTVGAAYPVGNDPGRRCPDISRMARLGWAPRVGLADGLARTWAWWRQAYGGGVAARRVRA